jgi:hypothetical protein
LEVSDQFWCSLVLCDVFDAFVVSLNSFCDRRHYVWCLMLFQRSLVIISGFCDFRRLLWYLLFFFFFCVLRKRLWCTRVLTAVLWCCHLKYQDKQWPTASPATGKTLVWLMSVALPILDKDSHVLCLFTIVAGSESFLPV